jgi:hypothetical protein
MALERELAFYETIKEDLIRHHQGKFVLIIGSEELGVFDRSEDAYRRGIELHGNVPMLIRQVVQNEPVELIPALGLINADM